MAKTTSLFIIIQQIYSYTMLKGNGNKKFNSSHLKDIQKQYIEIYKKYLKSTKCPPSLINFQPH